MPAKIIIEPGTKFNRWTVVNEATSVKGSQCRYNCKCDCGSVGTITSQDLRTGHSKSCGCHKNDANKNRLTTHGHARAGEKAPEYSIWVSMRQRCNNPNNRAFKNYGARGIKVCERWSSYSNFIADMGSRPSPELTIERMNNDGNYEPSNCIWDTRENQNNNRRSTQ